jgi:hypothetical protein
VHCHCLDVVIIYTSFTSTAPATSLFRRKRTPLALQKNPLSPIPQEGPWIPKGDVLAIWKEAYGLQKVPEKRYHDRGVHALSTIPNPTTAIGEFRGAVWDCCFRHYLKHGTPPSLQHVEKRVQCTHNFLSSTYPDIRLPQLKNAEGNYLSKISYWRECAIQEIEDLIQLNPGTMKTMRSIKQTTCFDALRLPFSHYSKAAQKAWAALLRKQTKHPCP